MILSSLATQPPFQRQDVLHIHQAFQVAAFQCKFILKHIPDVNHRNLNSVERYLNSPLKYRF